MGMGAKGAVEIIFRSDIGDTETIAARTKEYEDRFLSPFVAAERGYRRRPPVFRRSNILYMLELSFGLVCWITTALRTVVSKAKRSVSVRSENALPTHRASTPFNLNLLSPNSPFWKSTILLMR
jgi:hypothetical protein